MTDEPGTPIAPAGDWAKPVDTGLKGLMARYWGPKHVRNMADAEAYRRKTLAEADIEIEDLQRRAAQRRREEDARHQLNMESIVAKAIPHLKEDVDASQMNDDWIANFFDKSRIVSDMEMQSLWTKILAGEANNPGAFAKRTVNLVGELEKEDAHLFTKLCDFMWTIGESIEILILDIHMEIYKRNGIDIDALMHLHDIGLVQFDFTKVFRSYNLPQDCQLFYYGRLLELDLRKTRQSSLQIGSTLLTKVGRELAPISGSAPVDGFFDFVKDWWNEFEPKPKTEGEPPSEVD